MRTSRDTNISSWYEEILLDRFAAYAASLDQEQKTATAYADAVTELERCLQHARSRGTR